MQCGTCTHAVFERTPTGRFKRGCAGLCGIESDLMKMAEDCAAPCVIVNTRSYAIWPDTCATNCSHYKQPDTKPTGATHE